MTGIERHWHEQDEKRRAELTSRAGDLRHELAAIENELFPYRQWQWANAQANAGMGGIPQGSWMGLMGGTWGDRAA